MGPRNDEMQRSKTPESEPGSAETAAPGSRTAISPRPRQTIIHSGFANQSYSRPRLSPLRRFSFQPVLQATQDRFPDHLETLGQGMTVGIGFDRHSGGRIGNSRPEHHVGTQRVSVVGFARPVDRAPRTRPAGVSHHAGLGATVVTVENGILRDRFPDRYQCRKTISDRWCFAFDKTTNIW